jgi:hypothetical protein
VIYLQIILDKDKVNSLFSLLYFLKKRKKMSRDEQLKNRWNKVVEILSNQFADGDVLDLDAIIYLIGVQELGKLKEAFKKDEKVNLMHIAICRLLEPYGYYEFDFVDKDGWPHYTVKEELPPLKAGEQSILMKDAIVSYFLEKELID